MSPKTKPARFCLLMLLALLFQLSACGLPKESGVGVAYVVNDPVYARAGDRLFLREGTKMVLLTARGEKVPLGETTSVTCHAGVFFCKDAEDKTTHFVLNGVDSGTWADDALFYDGHAGMGITSAPEGATLFPQTVNEDADRSYNPERMGYINCQRVWMLSPHYLHDGYEREHFSEGVALPLDWDTRKQMFLTEDGQSAPLCDLGSGWLSEFGQFHDGLMWVKQEYGGSDGEKAALYQFLTKDNQPLQPRRYYGNVRDFSEGLAAVQKEGLWGFIDTNGDTVIDFQYSVAGDFHEGRAAVSDQQGRLFYVDKTGTCVSQSIAGYEFTGEARGGLAKVILPEGGFGLVNESGTLVSERSADYIWDYNVWSALLLLEGSGSMVVVLPNGVNLYSDHYFNFYGNVCAGEWDGKAILYSLETGEKLKTAHNIKRFHEGLAFCRDGSQCGYIDQSGRWVISSWRLLPSQTNYTRLGLEESEFSGGLALANYNGQNVMLYNPLIYKEDWVADEFDRAVSLGLGDESMDGDELTTDQLIALVEDFQAFVRSHLEDGVFPVAPAFRAKEDYLTAEHGGQITREELAVCLSRLAEDLGENTRNYTGFYADQDAIIYPHEVNYTASLALFDVENNTFDPQSGVSQREAVILFLRFTEAML